jgi:hypothetical protein
VGSGECAGAKKFNALAARQWRFLSPLSCPQTSSAERVQPNAPLLPVEGV